jgi:membrane associated rhomboid family serine protease
VPPDLPIDDDLPVPGLVAVGVLDSPGRAHEEGLVVLACGEPYWVLRDEEGRWLLLVRPERAELVARQLALYRDESSHPRPRRPRPPRGQRVRLLPLLCAPVAWSVVFVLQQARPGLTGMGLADARLVLEHGEWWRVLTALTLHGDAGHLMSNCFGWLLFAGLLATSTGSGLAMLLALLGGAAGNVVNLFMMHDAGHQSIGASTALFALLGTQTALAFFAGRPERVARRILVPLFCSVALLSLMGLGGPGTDVGAHAWGWACGIALGLPIGRPLRQWKTSFARDWLLTAACACVVALAWTLAVS